MTDILDMNSYTPMPPEPDPRNTWKLVNEVLGFEVEFTGRVIVKQETEERAMLTGLPLGPTVHRKAGEVKIVTEIDQNQPIYIRCDPRFAGLLIDPNLSLRPDGLQTPDRRPGQNPPTAL